MNEGYLCPRFEYCNAAYCPGLGGKHLKGEPVCFYLREAVKNGGSERISGIVPRELEKLVLADAHNLVRAAGPLGDTLRASALAGSIIENSRRFAEQHGFKAKS